MKTNVHINKLIKLLSEKGIFVKEDDELRHDGQPLENIVFYNNKTKTKIYNDIFYRKSGVCKTYLYKEDKKGQPVIIIKDMTDDFFYTYLYNLIMLHF